MNELSKIKKKVFILLIVYKLFMDVLTLLTIPIISSIASCERNFKVICVALKLMNFGDTELVYKHRYLNSVSLKIYPQL